MHITSGELHFSGRLRLAAVCAICFVGLMGGCSSTPGDPFEKINREIYKFNESLDSHIIKPATDVYVKVIPQNVRTGIGNAFDNLGYLNVIANDFLQAKWKQGFSDTGRMAVNSTVGILGFFDPATKWGMPQHSNQLGTTLGKWGVPPGPYLVIPVLGPYTLCDTPGIAMVTVTNPLYWWRPEWYVTVPLAVLATMDARSRLDFIIRFRSETALDPYVFTRDAYLQYRNARIFEGVPNPATTQDIYDEDLGPATQPAGKAAPE